MQGILKWTPRTVRRQKHWKQQQQQGPAAVGMAATAETIKTATAGPTVAHQRIGTTRDTQPLQGHQNQWNGKHLKVNKNENFLAPILNFVLLRFWKQIF